MWSVLKAIRLELRWGIVDWVDWKMCITPMSRRQAFNKLMIHYLQVDSRAPADPVIHSMIREELDKCGRFGILSE